MSKYEIKKWNQGMPPNAAQMRTILVAEGYRVFQWADRPETVYGPHKHNEDQSHWIISGALELSVMDEGTFVLEAGDRDLMPAGTYHSASVVGEETVVYLIGEKIG